MRKLTFLLLATTTLAADQPFTLTTKPTVAGDAYTEHSNYRSTKTVSMELLEDGLPKDTARPTSDTDWQGNLNLTAVSTTGDTVDRIECAFGKILSTYTNIDTDPDTGKENREFDEDDYQQLSNKSFILSKTTSGWQVTGDGKTQVPDEVATHVLDFHRLTEDPPQPLFPPQNPVTSAFSPGEKFTPGNPAQLSHGLVGPFIEGFAGFKTDAKSKTSGTLTLKEITSDGQAVFRIKVDAEADQTHDFFENLKMPSTFHLDGTISFDAESGWLRATEITSTITSTYPMGIQGIAWNQTDRTTIHSKSTYQLSLNKK